MSQQTPRKSKPKLSRKLLSAHGIEFFASNDPHLEQNSLLDGSHSIVHIKDQLVRLRQKLPKDAELLLVLELEDFKNSGQDSEEALRDGWSLMPPRTDPQHVYYEERRFGNGLGVDKFTKEYNACWEIARRAKRLRTRNEAETGWMKYLQSNIFKEFEDVHDLSNTNVHPLRRWKLHEKLHSQESFNGLLLRRYVICSEEEEEEEERVSEEREDGNETEEDKFTTEYDSSDDDEDYDESKAEQEEPTEGHRSPSQRRRNGSLKELRKHNLATKDGSDQNLTDGQPYPSHQNGSMCEGCLERDKRTKNKESKGKDISLPNGRRPSSHCSGSITVRSGKYFAWKFLERPLTLTIFESFSKENETNCNAAWDILGRLAWETEADFLEALVRLKRLSRFSRSGFGELLVTLRSVSRRGSDISDFKEVLAGLGRLSLRD